MKNNEIRKQGQKLAERGITQAALDHEPQIRRDTLRFLKALLASPNGRASLDTASGRLLSKYRDGGKWRASIPIRLRAKEIIAANGVVKSIRPTHHAGYITEWRLIDRKAAERLRDELQTALAKGGAK